MGGVIGGLQSASLASCINEIGDRLGIGPLADPAREGLVGGLIGSVPGLGTVASALGFDTDALGGRSLAEAQSLQGTLAGMAIDVSLEAEGLADPAERSSTYGRTNPASVVNSYNAMFGITPGAAAQPEAHFGAHPEGPATSSDSAAAGMGGTAANDGIGGGGRGGSSDSESAGWRKGGYVKKMSPLNHMIRSRSR